MLAMNAVLPELEMLIDLLKMWNSFGRNEVSKLCISLKGRQDAKDNDRRRFGVHAADGWLYIAARRI
jgi:hypothetical protein